MQDIVVRLAIVLIGLYVLYKFFWFIPSILLWGCNFTLTVIVALIPTYLLFLIVTLTGAWILGVDEDVALDFDVSVTWIVVYLVVCGLISTLVTYAMHSDPEAFSERKSRRRY